MIEYIILVVTLLILYHSFYHNDNSQRVLSKLDLDRYLVFKEKLHCLVSNSKTNNGTNTNVKNFFVKVPLNNHVRDDLMSIRSHNNEYDLTSTVQKMISTINEKINTINEKLVPHKLNPHNIDDDIELDVWYIKNPHSKTTVFLLHGCMGNVTHYYDIIEFIYQFSSVIIFDYRNYGNSNEVHASNFQIIQNDVEIVWNYCVNNFNFDISQTIIMGESLGCNLAIWLTHYITQCAYKVNTQKIKNGQIMSIPKALILNFPFIDKNAIVEKLQNCCDENAINHVLNNFIGNENDIYNWMSTFDKTMPIIIAHSNNDEIISYSHAEKLYSYANKLKLNISIIPIDGTHYSVVINDKYVYSITKYLQQ